MASGSAMKCCSRLHETDRPRYLPVEERHHDRVADRKNSKHGEQDKEGADEQKRRILARQAETHS